jgi:hypothetical protein
VSPANRHVVITALGLTQILAWGSTFYLLAVLAKPIVADTHCRRDGAREAAGR